MIYDILIRNADILDGSGSPSFRTSVAIKNGRIVKMGDNIDPGYAETVIDGTGRYLCPGFIDIHSHSDLELCREKYMENKLMQGITTEVIGNCGVGVFPVTEETEPLLRYYSECILGPSEKFDWTDFSGYGKHLEKQTIGTNIMSLTAHTALRTRCMKGNINRAATDEEIDSMCDELDRSLEQGSLGFSTGLYYAPCVYAERKELIAFLKVVRKHDALFAVHHRCEGDDIVDSIKEVISLAEETGVRLEISHLKVIGRKNQMYLDEVIGLIEEAGERGLRIGFDQYPYEYGSTSLRSLLPPEYLSLSDEQLDLVLRNPDEREKIKVRMQNPDGWDSIYSLCGFDNISICSIGNHKEYEGRTITEIAFLNNQDPFDAFFDIISDIDRNAVMIDITQSIESVRKVLCHPLMCFGTDSLYVSDRNHPRSYMAAVHLIDRFVRKTGVIALADAINKMTLACAQRIGLKDRGLIRPGYFADLVLFDYNGMRDLSTQAEPKVACPGIDTIFVNGKIAYRDHKICRINGGKFICRNQGKII